MAAGKRGAGAARVGAAARSGTSWRTLRANVELPLAIRGLSRAERRTQAEAWLSRVGLAEYARQLPHRVSG